jgi:predicted nucleic-acid-binding Zn-ribbon protein
MIPLPNESQEPQTYNVKGIDLKCPICNNDHFRTRKVLLNTTAMSFFNLDWANRNATCFICTNCTYIMWFFGED